MRRIYAVTDHDPHATQVQIAGGDRLVVLEENEDGVVTDAGTIPWSDVDCFWCWHAPTQRWMSIPKN